MLFRSGVIRELFESRPGVTLRLSSFASKSMLEKAAALIGASTGEQENFVAELEQAMTSSERFSRNRTRLDDIISGELPRDAVEIIGRRILPLAGFFGWPPSLDSDVDVTEDAVPEKAPARKTGRGKKKAKA